MNCPARTRREPGPCADPRHPKGTRLARVLLVAVLLLPAGQLWGAVALSITSGGAWTLALGSGNLSGAAGSDLTMPQTSPNPQVTLRVQGVGTNTWNITVARDSNWSSIPATLEIQRTSNGSGAGTVNATPALNTYFAVTSTAVQIAAGTRNRTGLTFQFRINNATVAMGAGSWVTTLTYTLTSP